MRKANKQAAIGSALQTRLAPPIGDPAVNHYRRGAPAAVPVIGPMPGGQSRGAYVPPAFSLEFKLIFSPVDSAEEEPEEETTAPDVPDAETGCPLPLLSPPLLLPSPLDTP